MSVQSWLRLSLAAEIGPILGHRLLSAFGHPDEIFRRSREELLSVEGLGPSRLAGLMDPAWERAARDEAARARDCGVGLIPLDDPAYPPLLARLAYPPLVLWIRGELTAADGLSVAIVGPRKPSDYGRLMTQRLAGPLAAQGLTVVSGLADGIDSEAHREALAAQGRTVAVLGQGLGTPIYPSRNAELASRIVEERRGAILSIFPLATEPSAGLFPQRNEVIAGLALGTLVIEAAHGSGALITARHALDAGRTVMACPGDATRRTAQGTNRLIADGASLVQTPQDAMDALGPDLRNAMLELGLSERVASATSEPSPAQEAAAPPLAVSDPLGSGASRAYRSGAACGGSDTGALRRPWPRRLRGAGAAPVARDGWFYPAASRPCLC